MSGRFLLHRLHKVGSIWHARIRDVRTGRVVKRTTGERTKAKAERRVHEIITEMAGGREDGSLEVEFETAFSEYLELKDVRPVTLKAYRHDLEGVYAPFFEHRLTDDITFGDIGRFLKRLSTDGATARTRSKHLSALRSFFRWAVRMGYAESNPCDDHKVQKGAQRRGVALTEEEASALLVAARTPAVVTMDSAVYEKYEQERKPPEYLFVAVAIALYTGLRRRNVTELRWEQVSFQKKTISISAHEMKAKEPHTVPIHPALQRLLRQVLRSRDAVEPTEPVLGDNVAVIRKSFKSALKRADLPESTRWHDLRHTFSTWMQRVAPYATVKRLLGHSTANDVTLLYSHVSTKDMRAEVEKLPDLITEAATADVEAVGE